MADGRIVLLGNAGLVAESTDNGATFTLRWSSAGRGFASVVEVPGGLVVAGESGVRPLDPTTFALVTVVLAITAALSIAGPAWRAARIDPAAALRNR